jgi:hypothetical protein
MTPADIERARRVESKRKAEIFVQIGWSNENQIGYVTEGDCGLFYADREDSDDVPIYRATHKDTQDE